MRFLSLSKLRVRCLESCSHHFRKATSLLLTREFNTTTMAGVEDKENGKAANNEEQEVTIEKVVAKDNKGIDYSKLISE